jgi:arsenite methyltransferase
MRRVDYGLDAPGVVRNFAIAGALLAVAAAAFVVAGVPFAPELVGLAAVMFLATVALMVHSSRRGKLIERDRLLDGLRLRGDEQVLDVGCGRGLLLLGAAKRLPHGRAVGVDIWSAEDQSDNSRAATLANAEAEGVGGRVEVVDADMRALPFADASFDAVVSSIAIHNLDAAYDRERACHEIARVLRPGARVAVLDLRATGEYAIAFEDARLVDVERSRMSFRMYPPVRVVTARRPAADQ